MDNYLSVKQRESLCWLISKLYSCNTHSHRFYWCTRRLTNIGISSKSWSILGPLAILPVLQLSVTTPKFPLCPMFWNVWHLLCLTRFKTFIGFSVIKTPDFSSLHIFVKYLHRFGFANIGLKGLPLYQWKGSHEFCPISNNRKFRKRPTLVWCNNVIIMTHCAFWCVTLSLISKFKMHHIYFIDMITHGNVPVPTFLPFQCHTAFVKQQSFVFCVFVAKKQVPIFLW